MYDFLRDLRVGARSLRQRPLFLAAATLTLGVGLGAGTAVFSVIEAALLQPFPFRDADRLGVVWGVAGPEQDIRGASPVEIRDWESTVDAMGPLSRYLETTLNLAGDGGATQLEAELVGPDFFRILGVAPALGRGFVAEDDVPGAGGGVVISHSLWQDRFGGTGDVLGRPLRLDDVELPVLGVMPEGFRGLSFDTEVWYLLGSYASAEAMAARGGRYLAAVGRLAPGATSEIAQGQLSAAAERLAEAYPDTNGDRGALLFSLRDFYVGPVRGILLMILGGVGLLLLIAAANVANLQLVRSVERRREVALRYALGAGRRSVARHLVAESLILAAAGAAAGIVLAWLGTGLLLPLVPEGVLPPYAEPAIDGPVLLFGIAAALLTGVIFGLAPVLRAARQNPAATLRAGDRGTTAARTARRGRGPGAQQAVIVAEVALALVLLVSAGLAIRSLRDQLAVEPGFQADGVLAARVSLTGDAYDRPARLAFVDGLLVRLGGTAGVQGAAVTSDAPLRGYTGASFVYRAEDPENEETRIRFYRHTVTPGYFEVAGIPIVAGRPLSHADHADAAGVAVVSQAFAAKVWPGQRALGRLLRFGGDTATVVGVAGDVHQRDLTTSLMDPGEDPDVYFAYAQVPAANIDILVRTDADPGTLAGSVRREVAALDETLPLYDVATMSTVLARQTGLGRLVSALLALFGALALGLAAIGLYGVLAFVVRGRRREIAIRSALGARPGEILAMVMRQGLALVAVGVGLGFLGALAAGRVAASLLFGARAVDPVVLGGTAAALLAVAALASWVPARAATRVDPGAALGEP